jgi:prophage antirepressor-like protein
MADTSASISPFNFGDHAVRVVIQDGNPWFVASDVCEALDYKNTSDAIGTHLEDDEKMTIANGDSHSGKRGGARLMTLINESGLYALVLRSRKPEARKFAKWVTSEVLPSIRKTGTYTQPAALSPAQKQHLAELVDIVASSGKQTHAETWARFHRKFKINSYHQLPADQFDTACQYLRGKLDGHDIGALVKKHFPTAAPALPAPTGTERMLITKNLATGETTVENLGTQALLFKTPDHMAHAVMNCRLGVEVTQKIAQHAMMGMMANAVDLKKQIRSQAVTETLSQMASLPVADLVELSTSAHTFLSGMALKTAPKPADAGDRLLNAALAATHA